MAAEAMSAAATKSQAPTDIGLGQDRSVRLGPVIGRGSSATVFRGLLTAAHNIRRPVALKLFDPIGSEEADALSEALARTARKTACVCHPNVVAPVDFTTFDRRPVLVNELVDGASLGRLQDAYQRLGRRVPIDLALFVALEIAEALSGAREARTPEGRLLNMRHHDLTPNEVLISWHGEVKVSDFGVSAAIRTSSGVTSLAQIARRCATMAPEVVLGERGDARSDVFSLGIILRQMLVGPRFPESMSEKEKIELAREGAIPIGLMESPVFEPVATILQRALEVEPNHRYPDARRLAFDLRRACLSMGVGDGRVFLRSAMRELLGAELAPGDPTQPEPGPRTGPVKTEPTIMESGEIRAVTSDEERQTG